MAEVVSAYRFVFGAGPVKYSTLSCCVGRSDRYREPLPSWSRTISRPDPHHFVCEVRVGASIWGSLKGNFQQVHNDFIDLRGQLGITDAEFALILTVLRFRGPSGHPYPANSTVAERMGCSVAKVKRLKAELVERGFLKVVYRKDARGDSDSSFWDFTPLIGRLAEARARAGVGSEMSLGRLTDEPTGRLRNEPGVGSRVSLKQYSLNKTKKEQDKTYALSRGSGEGSQENLEAEPGSGIADQEWEEVSGAFGDSNIIAFPVGSVADQAEDEVMAMAAGDDAKSKIAAAAAVAATARQRSAKVRSEKEARRQAKLANGGYTAKVGASCGAISKLWVEEMEAAFPDLTIVPWDSGGKEFGMVARLVRKYGGDPVANTFRYTIRNWEPIRKRFLKGEGVAPTMSFIVKCFESLFNESQRWMQARLHMVAYEDWQKKNPHMWEAPAQLEADFAKAKAIFKELGL